MTKVLVTFPGRAGDLIWALPTVRAISESVGVPVDLQIAGEFVTMASLLVAQPYIGAVWPDPRWGLSAVDSWRAPRLPRDYDAVVHLGYRRWPELPLPMETWANGLVEAGLHGIAIPAEVDLGRPWITATPWQQSPHRLAIGWTDCHFELKYGLMRLLQANWGTPEFTGFLLAAPGSRWTTEAEMEPVLWEEAACRIAAADLFLGDCSALHVLAVALGTPVVCYEPMEARHNPVFWPLGMDGPRVRCVKGLDGKPTIDARHTADTLKEVLGG